MERRRDGEPIAYILGRQGFWTLDLDVTPDTLIPRPETELLVELALGRLPAGAPLTVADLGTGSGAIAAALASERPAWTLIAVDRSPAAVAVAWANARRLRLPNLRPLVGDWFGPLAPGSLDAVVSNPPYVAASDPHLGRGDLRFEPRPPWPAARTASTPSATSPPRPSATCAPAACWPWSTATTKVAQCGPSSPPPA